MDFFQAQALAKRNSRWLVWWFLLLVLLLIGLTDVLLLLGLGAFDVKQGTPVIWSEWLAAKASLVATVSGLVGLGIGGAVWFRHSELSEGGAAVARLLGGRLLDRQQLNQPFWSQLYQLDKTQLQTALNVVEEMAIAAGMPVPAVYILESNGINAFAAGYQQQDAVIGLTVGTVQRLNRDELQGVVGHEFSHILNGDMRLNIRLMAMIFGLTCVSELGRVLMRVRSGSSSKNNGNQVALIGLGLFVLGAIGVLFGSILRAAISRQREYLADASAVQFTRNAHGIAGALYKIGQFGSRLQHEHAAEVQHFMLSSTELKANTDSASWFGWMASHPPLSKRIAALMPGWRPGMALPGARANRSEVQDADEGAVAHWQQGLEQRFYGIAAVVGFSAPSSSAALEPLNRQALSLLATADGCEALVYASVIDDAQLTAQLSLLKPELSEPLWLALEYWLSQMPKLKVAARMSLLQVAAPVLRQMSPEQQQRLKRRVLLLVELDGDVNQLEQLLWLWLLNCTETPVRTSSHGRLHTEKQAVLIWVSLIRQLLSSPLSDSKLLALLPNDLLQRPDEIPRTVSLSQLADALPRLHQLQLSDQQQLWHMVLALVKQDGNVSAHELMLLHTCAAMLRVPLPT